MSQRNNFDTAELPPRTGSLGVTSGQDPFANDAANTRISSPGSRTRKQARIPVSLPVVLRDQFGGQNQARTQFVMVRGAIVASTGNLRVGHKLTIQNVKSGKSAECHVIAIEPGIAGSSTVEIEFTGTQPDFWPVQFPTDSASEALPMSQPLTSADQLSLAADISAPSSFKSPPPTPRTSSAISSPPARPRETELVSLADSFEPSLPAPATVQKPLPQRTPPPTDSVAQFRAANRAAHRREQRMRTLYSIASVLALVALGFAAKNWLSHRSETVERPEPVAKSTTTIKKLSPPTSVAAKTSASTSASTSTSASQTVANVFAHLKSAPAKMIARIKLPVTTAKADGAPAEVAGTAPTETPAPEAKSSADWQPVHDTQVTVRHGSSLASTRKAANDPGEEPVALPLSASVNASSQTNPAALSAVVAQAPTNAAVLVPEVPKQRLISPAKLMFSVPAQYPAVARQLRTEGEVVLNLEIDVSGKVSDAKVISGAPMLRTAALDAVRRWKYEPATLANKPVPSTQTVKVDFRLK